MLTLSLLEKLWEQAKIAQQSPLLIVDIRRNDNEVFCLTCSLKVERK